MPYAYDAYVTQNARRVAETERIATEQRSVIARLEGVGIDTGRARELLAAYEDTLSLLRTIQVELEGHSRRLLDFDRR